jgi:hypothetical protein
VFLVESQESPQNEGNLRNTKSQVSVVLVGAVCGCDGSLLILFIVFTSSRIEKDEGHGKENVTLKL